MSKRPGAWLAGICFALAIGPAAADSWRLPTPETYASDDGTWRLTVTPRALTSQMAYFMEQAGGAANPGGVPGGAATATGRMEQLRDGEWHLAWEAPLANDVAPVEVLVGDGGLAVTFDNWHSTGYGDTAVVFYDTQGTLVRSLALRDFLPEAYVEALPRSVSSLQWRGGPAFVDGGVTVVVPVRVPAYEPLRPGGSPAFVEVRFDARTGEATVPDGPAWQAALWAANEVNRRREAAIAARREALRAPLAAPAGADTGPWFDYLDEAFHRVDPEWEGGYAAIRVVPGDGDPAAAIETVGELLADEAEGDAAIMLASPSQDALVGALRAQSGRLAPGALADARIYLALDDAHFAQAREALAGTGAALHQLDITTPIPQRPERLRQLEARWASETIP